MDENDFNFEDEHDDAARDDVDIVDFEALDTHHADASHKKSVYYDAKGRPHKRHV